MVRNRGNLRGTRTRRLRRVGAVRTHGVAAGLVLHTTSATVRATSISLLVVVVGGVAHGLVVVGSRKVTTTATGLALVTTTVRAVSGVASHISVSRYLRVSPDVSSGLLVAHSHMVLNNRRLLQVALGRRQNVSIDTCFSEFSSDKYYVVEAVSGEIRISRPWEHGKM